MKLKFRNHGDGPVSARTYLDAPAVHAELVDQQVFEGDEAYLDP